MTHRSRSLLLAGALSSIPCLLALLHIYSKRKVKTALIKTPGSKCISLMRMESILNQSLPPVSTATIYACDGEADMERAISHIKDRVASIVALNPWLSAFLVKDGLLDTAMIVSPPLSDRDLLLHKHFRLENDFTLSNLDKMEDRFGRLMSYVVKTGGEVVGKESEALFKVAVIKTSAASFIVVVSLSHFLGDGATFYEIYRMLSADSSVQTLDAVRQPGFQDWALSIGKGSLAYFSSPSHILRMLTNLAFNKISFLVGGDINLHKIQSIKQEFIKSTELCTSRGQAAKASFLSTNDILTSWYFRKSRCTLGFMAVNFRDRFPSATRRHAGNYEGSIMYLKEDFHTPELIRKSVASTDYSRQVTLQLPGFWATQHLLSALCTSWVTFYHDNTLPGSSAHVAHFPLVESHTPIRSPFNSLGIFYKSSADQVSFLGMGNHKAASDKLNWFEEGLLM